MDVHKTLRELHAEKKRLDATISALERQLKAPLGRASGKRRGRKSMSAAERRKVSERMSRYWEARRAQQQTLQASSGSNSGEVSA